jgi:hypothetical protein
MKYLLLLAAALLASSAASATNYSGTWSLDKARSTNLPPYYADKVKSHTLTNKQDEQQLTVDVEIDGGGPAPDKVHFVYNLDGSETMTNTVMRTPAGEQHVPTTMKATVNKAGDVHIDIVRDVKMGEKTFKAASTEDWSLSPDGQTLTVHMVRQNQGSDLVFVKQ